ncbi:hypothetical protein [Neptuniibacter sp. QD37_11]|uniref:hypothetical protein n=1 Tax=Neptuniibacter sp. QD37_11 TaxID=3398209 RepID=UPI0039F616F9
MAKHIDATDIKNVNTILDSWKGPLTWDALVEALYKKHKRETTRQALYRNQTIKEAFHHRKKALSSGETTDSAPQSLKSAGQTIDRLRAKNDRVENENECLLEMFRIWQYNAHKHGLTDAQLNEPLPRIDKRS